MIFELKLCPFCGGMAKHEHSTRTELNAYGIVVSSSLRFRVACTKCGCATPWRQTEEGAVSNWNRRKDD